jgi:hypothetical protein
MAKFVCPNKLMTMVRQFYDGIVARVLDDGKTFIDLSMDVSNGVQQGWVLAPTLFSMMLSAMLSVSACIAATDKRFMANFAIREDCRTGQRSMRTHPTTFSSLMIVR